MAANKFATILHRNTNKLTLILVYAMLEWILIMLLLLNSLFSFIIIKFADYVGLRRPCLWCIRLDRFFEPGLKNNSYQDLVCEVHADDISKLGNCSNHRKLVESQDMCLDCSSLSRSACTDFSNDIAFFPLGKQIGMINGNVGVDSKCSCCGVSLHGKIFPPYFVIKPSWEVLDCKLKRISIAEADPDDEIHALDGDRSDYLTYKLDDEMGIDQNGDVQMGCFVDQSVEKRVPEIEEENSSFPVVDYLGLKDIMVNEDEKIGLVMGKEDDLSSSMADLSQMDGEICSNKDALSKVQHQHLEFVIDRDDYQLILVEFTDSSAMEKQEDVMVGQDFVMEFDFPREKFVNEAGHEVFSIAETVALVSACEHKDEANVVEVELMECEQVGLVEETQTPSTDGGHALENASMVGEIEGDDSLVLQEDSKSWSDETDAEVSIGTEIPEHVDDEYHNDEHCSVQPLEEDPSTSCDELRIDDNPGVKQAEEGFIEFRTISFETNAQALHMHLSLYLGLNDIEEDKIPDTSTSLENLQHLYKKLPLMEKRELCTEENRSLVSEMDYGEGILTIEELKSTLRAEMKALNTLYAELEEEMSVSVVTVNQTMTMINRLQEEKAAMRIEAL